MIDFPITDLLDDAASTQWLEQHLHPNGLHCPHCDSANGRLFRPQAKKARELSRAECLAWIERDGSELPLTVQADMLGLSRRSLYYQPKGPSPEEVQIKHRIDEIYTEMPAYGSRRMTAQLRLEGYPINRKAVQRHIREGVSHQAIPITSGRLTSPISA
jgi:hypothetical protein